MKTIDKANRLVEKFREEMPDIYFEYMDNNAIQCAKIAVDEIIEQLHIQYDEMDFGQSAREYINGKEFYWQEVKNELNKMS